MLLAARALGLGATLTMLYLNFEKEMEAEFGLPPNVHSYALLPIGYPDGTVRASPPYPARPMSSMKIGGASPTGIKFRQHEVGCGAPR